MVEATRMPSFLLPHLETYPAPFLSFDEALIYTELPREELIELLERASLPRKHISRRRLDQEMAWQKRIRLARWSRAFAAENAAKKNGGAH